MPDVLGFPDGMIGSGPGKVSKTLIAWIVDSVNNVTVQGLIGQGTSRELSANWEQPFSSDTLMSMVSGAIGGAVGGLLSKLSDASGMTTVTSFNSKQVWNSGNHSINLVFKFMAFSDPIKEVMMAIAALERMSSIDAANTAAQDNSRAGRQPSPITLNIGRLAIFQSMIIKSVSVPLDKEKDKNGNLIRAEVSVALEPYEMINRKDIFGTFGL